MAEIKVDISELKGEGGDLIKELTEYLKEKTHTDIEGGVDSLTIKCAEKAVLKGYARVLLRKFLHRSDLKDRFRVIAAEENTLKVKKRKIEEEE